MTKEEIKQILNDSDLSVYISGETTEENADAVIKEVADALLQLHLEGVREIIGKLEKADFSETTKDFPYQIRNKLRLRQLEKLEEVSK